MLMYRSTNDLHLVQPSIVLHSLSHRTSCGAAAQCQGGMTEDGEVSAASRTVAFEMHD